MVITAATAKRVALLAAKFAAQRREKALRIRNKIKKQFPYWKKEIYILEDIHFNENGHRLLTEIIYRNAFEQ